MKKILCIIATKLPPSLVQNVLGRLGSKTPELFVRIQKYSAFFIAIFASIAGAIELAPELIPHSHLITEICKYGLAIFLGIGGGASLPTTDPKFIGGDVKGVIVNEAQTKEQEQQ